jgi:hypothetical protein
MRINLQKCSNIIAISYFLDETNSLKKNVFMLCTYIDCIKNDVGCDVRISYVDDMYRNPLTISGTVRYTTCCNIQQQHCFCVTEDCQNEQDITSLNSVNRLVFVTETRFLYCDVGPECLFRVLQRNLRVRLNSATTSRILLLRIPALQ